MRSIRYTHGKLRRIACIAAPAALLMVLPGAASAARPYVSPFSTDDYYVGRTDMGVDVCMSPGDPIGAVGDGVVVGINRDWYKKQPYIWYRLTRGPYAGRLVYVAEQLDHLARVGQTLRAGQPVARFARRGTCIEMGWGAANGATLAQATTGYHEGAVTPAGVSFARFLIATGVQGTFELHPPPPKRKTHQQRP
jgi:hypothetical protein